jgi:hypothetical protein
MHYQRLALLGVALSAAYAQNPVVWRYWSMADGLFESYVSGIKIGQDGVAWARHGRVPSVSAMDGYGIRQVVAPGGETPVFGCPPPARRPSIRFRARRPGCAKAAASHAPRHRKGLWFASLRALTRLEGGRWESYELPPQWPPLLALTESLLVLRDGSIPLRCGGGKILRFDPRRRVFSQVQAPAGHRYQTVATRGDGTAWVVARVANLPGIELQIYDGHRF